MPAPFLPCKDASLNEVTNYFSSYQESTLQEEQNMTRGVCNTLPAYLLLRITENSLWYFTLTTGANK